MLGLKDMKWNIEKFAEEDIHIPGVKGLIGIKLNKTQKDMFEKWENGFNDIYYTYRSAGITTGLLIKMAYDILNSGRGNYVYYFIDMNRNLVCDFISKLKYVIKDYDKTCNFQNISPVEFTVSLTGVNNHIKVLGLTHSAIEQRFKEGLTDLKGVYMDNAMDYQNIFDFLNKLNNDYKIDNVCVVST
jgi:hypothetical protein